MGAAKLAWGGADIRYKIWLFIVVRLWILYIIFYLGGRSLARWPGAISFLYLVGTLLVGTYLGTYLDHTFWYQRKDSVDLVVIPYVA